MRLGRHVIIGFAGGRIAQLPSNYLLLKNIDAVGVAWGMQLAHAPGMLRRLGAELATMYEAGSVRPVVAEKCPLSEGSRVLENLAARRAQGKSVLVVR